jgi:phosphonate transport system permease protein
MKKKPKSVISPIFRAGLSFLIPGFGQVLKREYQRAVGIFFAIASISAFAYWYYTTSNQWGWFIFPGLLWIWNIFDAFLIKGAPILFATVFWLGAAYAIGWQATEVDFGALLNNTERARGIIQPMLHPDFITRPTTSVQSWVEFQVPCTSTAPKAERIDDNGIHLLLTPNCGTIGDSFTLQVEGLRPDDPANIHWSNSIGDIKMLAPGFSAMLVVNANATGNLTAHFETPPTALIATGDLSIPHTHRIYVTQIKTLPGVILSRNGKYIVQGIYETIAMALLATAIGLIFAIPVGFLAARNLMSANALTKGIYYLIRSILNIFRSIEVLIWGIIFVVIIGLGTFAGMLAIVIHTIAALGKLYSEVIEGIDPGPIEAIKATGANWFQVVRYGVLPQVLPPFVALTIYRWDINVRNSTIVGFVGGGGIGLYLIQWINNADFRAVSSAFIAIGIVVILMDFFSAQLRKQII